MKPPPNNTHTINHHYAPGRAHARQLDRRYHPQASPPVTLTPGPVEQIVLDHDRIRGVVLGGYGEWSFDVESL